MVSVKIPDSVERIKKDAFSDCISLTFTNIPNSIKLIDSCAFAGCNLSYINKIPNSVEKVAEDAFDDCINLISNY